jgi:GNAT superfamily N-acetyltransferase
MRIDVAVETEISTSTRAQQLSALFDVPAAKKCRLTWAGEIPIDADDWNVGLIVGPSGSGKSSIAKQLFGERYHPELQWPGKSVIDDFKAGLPIETISEACQAVGFNTIPAWLRPYAVLSNGERFRVDLARRILELPDPIVLDEFTSVVDRQVAQIGSNAVQKFVRRNKRRFVAISCHYDIVDWLQPDWIFEPATMTVSRRLLRQRPALEVTIGRVPYAAWKLFAPFHYLTAELNVAARCYGLWVGDRLAAFAGILAKPVSAGANKGTAIAGVSRVVTLPDWQGLGLAFVLLEKLGAAHKAIGKRFRNYPAHPSFVRAHKPPAWCMIKRSGHFESISSRFAGTGAMGGRPCAIFEYRGPAMAIDDARRVLAK